MAFRQEKGSSLLKSIASSFIQKEIVSEPGVLISITGVELSNDLKEAKIFVSVFPESKEEKIIRILKNNQRRLKEFSKDKIKMKFLPHFEIEIDKGEKSRQRIDEILHK